MLIPLVSVDPQAMTNSRGMACIRVAIISDAAPERNGVGAYYRDLIEHLRDHVERVEIFCPAQTPSIWRGQLSFPLPGDSSQSVSIPPLGELSRRVRELAPHIVIVPTPGPYGLLGMHLAMRQGAGMVVGFHTHYERLSGLYWSRIFAGISRRYLKLSNQLLFRNAATVLANSPEMVAVAQAIGARNVQLMGTPISRVFLDQPVVPLAPKVSRVLFAGRLAPEKNIQAVITAAERLPHIEFQIAGDGPLRGYISERSKKLPNLTYLGWLGRAEVLNVLDGADMLVLPSHVESFGTIALEGMARNKSVLVSAQCGILNWPSLNRGIFHVGGQETVAEAIHRIASLDYSVRKKKAHVASQSARQLNEWTVGNWLQVLDRSVLAKNG